MPRYSVSHTIYIYVSDSSLLTYNSLLSETKPGGQNRRFEVLPAVHIRDPMASNAIENAVTLDHSRRTSLAQVVFNITELLESIILALPLSDICLAAHVSKSWYDLVSTSTVIKTRLLRDQTPVHASK